jgi:hypothetical protein
MVGSPVHPFRFAGKRVIQMRMAAQLDADLLNAC